MRYDAVIIGGGPAGSTAALYLAKAGKKVLLLEKETFPRFHIGESLLPYNMPLFREMGVLPALSEAGFVEKHGAQFFLANGGKVNAITFAEGSFTQEPVAIQVERSRFDEILLNHAAESGVDVREGHVVKDYEVSPRDGVSVIARNSHQETFVADFLIDASGTFNFTGDRERIKRVHRRLRKVAIFGHFSGVDLPDDKTGGDTLIARFKDAWFWLIPIGKQKASVGLVVDRDVFKNSETGPEGLFQEALESCEQLSEIMKDAERLGPLRNMADFSYSNKRLVSPRLIRVGDAAGFLDPIFSSGVYLAMLTGRNAARTTVDALEKNLPLTRGMKRYQRETWRYMRRYRETIELFYQRSFVELLLQPAPHLRFPCAVNAFLAGRIDGTWQVRWRLRLFYWLVRLNKVFPLAERLDFN